MDGFGLFGYISIYLPHTSGYSWWQVKKIERGHKQHDTKCSAPYMPYIWECQENSHPARLVSSGLIWLEWCQQQRQEEQELLRKRRAQMQRRGDSVEKDEQAFAASLGRMVEDCLMLHGVFSNAGALSSRIFWPFAQKWHLSLWNSGTVELKKGTSMVQWDMSRYRV